MSFITRVWNAIRNPARYRGKDLQGNKYFEMGNPNDHTRSKRIVQYYDTEDVWKYVGGGKRLPVQWSAWLTHTRPHPPTLKELQADLARQQRVSANVAVIEARDRAEEEEMLRIRRRDAKLALEGAAASASGAERVLGKSTPIPEPPVFTEATSTPASSSAPKAATEKEAGLGKVPTSVSATISPKVLPPAFLTPGTPRKPKSAISLPFTLPSIENVSEPPSLKGKPQVRQKLNSGNGLQTQKEAEWTKSLKKCTPLPSIPSRPIPDTESWTPKARRRG